MEPFEPIPQPEYTFPRPPLTSEDGMTAEFMQSCFDRGIIGYKEMRAWMANNFQSYEKVRDPGVDAMIDDVARSKQRQQEERDSEPDGHDPLGGGA